MGEPENAATRWLVQSVAALLAQVDATQPLREWAAEDYCHEDRGRLRLLGDHTGGSAAGALEEMWRANFELGRGGTHAHEVEVVSQVGDHLTLVRMNAGTDFFGADYLWIFELDDSLTKLRRTVNFDGDQLEEAVERLRELAASSR